MILGLAPPGDPPRVSHGSDRTDWDIRGCRSFRLRTKQLLMFQAIGSPGDRLKSLRVNLLAINHTSAERTVFDALDSVLHLLQHRPVDLRFRELLLFEFVVDALVAHFNGGPIDIFTDVSTTRLRRSESSRSIASSRCLGTSSGSGRTICLSEGYFPTKAKN